MVNTSADASGSHRVSVASSSATPVTRVQLILTPPPRNAPPTPRTWEPVPGRAYPRVFYLPGEEPAQPAYYVPSPVASPSPVANNAVSSPISTSGQPSTPAVPPNATAAPPLTLRDFLRIRVPEFQRRYSSIAPPHIVAQRQDLTSSTTSSFTWDSRLNDHTGSTRATSVFSDDGASTSDSGWETAEWSFWAPHSAESDLEDEEYNRAPILDIPIPTHIIVTDPDALSDTDDGASGVFDEDEEDGYAADSERAPQGSSTFQVARGRQNSAGLIPEFKQMSLQSGDAY